MVTDSHKKKKKKKGKNTNGLAYKIKNWVTDSQKRKKKERRNNKMTHCDNWLYPQIRQE